MSGLKCAAREPAWQITRIDPAVYKSIGIYASRKSGQASKRAMGLGLMIDFQLRGVETVSKLTIPKAVSFMKKRGMLLVFPQENRKEPASLWYEFFPRTRMRWEWDESGDNRVGELWFLREQLSLSRKVVYSKWFRGRATLIANDLFPALLKLANPEFPDARQLSFAAREILELLEEDSPLSTKQLKKLSGLQGKASETAYTRALKELWDKFLIVAYGEVNEGAFPSLAIGSTRVIFESLWQEAAQLTDAEATEIVEKRLPQGTSFRKYWDTLTKKWALARDLS